MPTRAALDARHVAGLHEYAIFEKEPLDPLLQLAELLGECECLRGLVLVGAGEVVTSGCVCGALESACDLDA